MAFYTPSVRLVAAVTALAAIALSSGAVFTLRAVNSNNSQVFRIQDCAQSHGSGACVGGSTRGYATSSGTLALSGALRLTGTSTGSCIEFTKNGGGGTSCCYVANDGTTFTCKAAACPTLCD